MATSSALIKSILHKSLAEGVYKDVTSRTSNYYYFLGKTLKWDDETHPPSAVDSFAHELAVRDDIITMKAIGPSDVSFVVPRINWVSGEVYDMYDDEYCDEVIGINIVNGGSGYTSLPTLTITGGGGSGAKFYPQVLDNQIVGIEYDFDLLKANGILDSSRGRGYVSEPTVTVTGGGGSGAILKAVVRKAASGVQKLEEAKFYVVTEDFNVYKCLDNNNGAKSTNKPIGTSTTPITFADGYVWKYMYTVPINLRSKFLSDQFIPVVSALTNQFYTNGSADSIIIDNNGSGYTYAHIDVIGDGYLEKDPIYLTSLTINNGGTGYTSPTVTFGDPVSGASPFIASSGVALGQRIKNSTHDFYEVVTPGTLSSLEPSHVLGTVQNGTAALKYVGTRAQATLTSVGGVITDYNLVGGIRDVLITNGGSGYTSAPKVNFSGGGGANASASCKLLGSSVLYVEVANPGSGYSSDPDVTFGDIWTASTAVTVGKQYYYSNKLYTVTVAGTTGTTAPTHTSGSVANGTATLTYAGVAASGSAVRRFGAGYSSAPSISISGGGTNASLSWMTAKSEALLYPVMDGGQIVGTVIKDAGTGYSAIKLNVVGDGDGAELSADLNIGTIQSLQANNEILTVKGTIDAIQVVSGGYGYGVATIEILGDGSGATAVAVLDSASGRISKVVITNRGYGYTFAKVVVTGNGHGAHLRAVMPPFGGHGRNAPDELYASTLMFYSNISNDLNQGVAVQNDYRQVGIIKNPRKFALDERFISQIGSACYIVQASAAGINTTYFPRDTNITVNRTVGSTVFQRRYRVVKATTSSALLQSLDNDVPQLNDAFTNQDGRTFTISSVGSPTVDKYSGQLLFIDNKAGFTPSTEETVTLRTVIKF